MTKSYTEKQSVQEAEYTVPYHYIPSIVDGYFSQALIWSWGMRYMAGIELVLSMLKNIQFKSLLDVGCGDGRFLREVSIRFPYVEICGIDYSEKAILLARTFNPSINYTCLDITTDNLGHQYDLVTMIEVLEHIPLGQVPYFLRSVVSSLAPGGKLILTVPHINKRLQDKHYQHFSCVSLREVLEPFFEVERIMPFDRKSRINGWFLKLLGYTGSNYVITNKVLNTAIFNRILHGCLREQPEHQCGRLLAVVR